MNYGIGVDFDGLTVRIAVAKKSRRQTYLADFAATAADVMNLEEGVITTAHEISERLSHQVNSMGLAGRRVAASVPGCHVLVKTVMIPVMKKREIIAAARYHALGVFSLPAEDTVLEVAGYELAGGYAQVTVIACRQTLIRQLETILLQAGLKPGALEIAPLAVNRILQDTGGKVAQLMLNNGSAVFSYSCNGCLKHLHAFSYDHRDHLYQEMKQNISLMKNNSPDDSRCRLIIMGPEAYFWQSLNPHDLVFHQFSHEVINASSIKTMISRDILEREPDLASFAPAAGLAARSVWL